jgi:AraC-like DNA-binding protein
MHGGKVPTKPILIPPGRVISRQSSNVIAFADPEVAAAMRYIRDHAYEPINVKNLLQEIPLSRRTLERRFVALLGRTPRAEIARLRLERAKSLLEETDLPIPAVAEKSGFIDRVVFSIFFRRQIGLSPMQYRSTRSPRLSEVHPLTQWVDHLHKRTRFHTQTCGFSTHHVQRTMAAAGRACGASRPNSRLKPPEMRKIILANCQKAFLTAAKLGELLHRNPDGLRNRFLKPMMDEGLLQRKYPDEPSRPDQAYTAKPLKQPAKNRGTTP